MKVLFLFLSMFSISLQAYGQSEILVQEGTVVEFILAENLDSRVSKLGDVVNLEVAADVIVGDDIVIIKKGDRATGKITEATKAKILGRKGKLDFTIDYVTTYFGKNMRIRSTNDADGKSRMGGVIAIAVLAAPIAIFIKGKDVTVEKGTSFSAYIDKEYAISKKLLKD